MLTIQIENEKLAQRLIKQAETEGRSVDAMVQEVISEAFDSPDELGIEYPRLDVREHMEVINNVLTAEEEELLAQNPDVRPFSHIEDSAKYIHDLRRKPRY